MHTMRKLKCFGGPTRCHTEAILGLLLYSLNVPKRDRQMMRGGCLHLVTIEYKICSQILPVHLTIQPTTFPHILDRPPLIR